MFIQIIQGRCHDAARMRQLGDEWAEKLGPGADGWIGGTYGMTDDDQFVAVVRFASREAAQKNSQRPEQGDWWQRMAACFDGEITFHDCDDVTLFLGGGSDEAGFVQVVQGRMADTSKLRAFMQQPMDVLHDARPEILGGTVAIASDGTFTETIAFRSESEARLGEKQGMPEEARREFASVMAEAEDVTYLDLHHPWFSSARV